MSGMTSYLSGLAAEDAVARQYVDRGYEPCGRRWRGAGGELDLIFERLGQIIFVEVKKGRDFATAAERITARQIERIFNAASAFLDTLPLKQNTETRFDAALVDVHGRIEIVENALGY